MFNKALADHIVSLNDHIMCKTNEEAVLKLIHCFTISLRLITFIVNFGAHHYCIVYMAGCVRSLRLAHVSVHRRPTWFL